MSFIVKLKQFQCFSNQSRQYISNAMYLHLWDYFILSIRDLLLASTRWRYIKLYKKEKTENLFLSFFLFTHTCLYSPLGNQLFCPVEPHIASHTHTTSKIS